MSPDPYPTTLKPAVGDLDLAMLAFGVALILACLLWG